MTVALGTAWLLARLQAVPGTAGRAVAIDGLRGFLAFGVFMHHACLWYFYLRDGRGWDLPPSHFYRHLGQSGVAAFFMITAFLFWTKLLKSTHDPLDWLRLYVSRVLRLTPLYVFAMFILFAFVAVLSAFELRESPVDVLAEAATWLTFTILGHPDINGTPNTATLIAGVTWSLPYEWMFYLLLPVGAMLLGRRLPLPWIVTGVAALILCVIAQPVWIHFMAFVGGIVAAYAVRIDALRRFAVKPLASALVLLLVTAAVWFSPRGDRPMSLTLISAAFMLIASGADIFGLLRSAPARLLGDLSYSIYLLHGLVLFTLFHFAIGPDASRLLSATQHWATIAITTPFLVLLCYATYRFIETPAMRLVPRATSWLRARGPHCPSIRAYSERIE